MKKLASFGLLIIFGLGYSQITQSIVNKEQFEQSGFPYKGKRVLQVENILTTQEENLFVFSKNERGSTQDSLYIQQFKKQNDNWVITAEKVIAEESIITSIWGMRKTFFDADKDGIADVLFIYSKHPKDDLDTQLDVVLLLIYKNKFYTIGNAGEDNYNSEFDYYEASIHNLPKAVQETVFDYWKKLDKS